MPNAKRQIWKIRVPKDVELTSLENKNEQEQNKNAEKNELREMGNQRKNDKKKERWMKKRWKMIFHEMILGLITLKHSLGLLIISFETPNPEPRPTLRT